MFTSDDLRMGLVKRIFILDATPPQFDLDFVPVMCGIVPPGERTAAQCPMLLHAESGIQPPSNQLIIDPSPKPLNCKNDPILRLVGDENVFSQIQQVWKINSVWKKKLQLYANFLHLDVVYLMHTVIEVTHGRTLYNVATFLGLVDDLLVKSTILASAACRIYGISIMSHSWQRSVCLRVTLPRLTGVIRWRWQLCFSAHTQV